MEYALRRPERVTALILIDTAPASHADFVAFLEALAATRTSAEAERIATLRGDPAYRRGDLEADAAFYRIHFRPALRRPTDVDRVVARLRSTFTPEAVVAARSIEDALYEATWRRDDYDLLPRLRTLAIPTLVVHGELDFIPVGLARHVASAIPDAEFVVLPDCGHFAFLEQPVRVHDAIERFLRRTA